ncbi:HNH endonuclease family protein [Demequina sp.]|uniref:HNH endonuclease family protein n=1 Tax=Demequina sp. TaxID=2050685 RepID=UPI003D0F64E4
MSPVTRAGRAKRSAVALVFVAVLAGCTPLTQSPAPQAHETATDPTPALSTWPLSDTVAADAISSLEVKGRAPKTGYARDEFGDGWVDVDNNGCFTRSDVLRAQLREIRTEGPCKVIAGVLDDPYTGAEIVFTPGDDTTVQIDHVVALSDAWQKGAQQWSYAKRVAFANDPLNLLAVDAAANQAKGDGDAATWLPPYKAFRCAYVARQVAVKLKYGAWVTTAEFDAMRDVLGDCPDELLPSPGVQPTQAPSP